jgi:predicted acyltransferase
MDSTPFNSPSSRAISVVLAGHQTAGFLDQRPRNDRALHLLLKHAVV